MPKFGPKSLLPLSFCFAVAAGSIAAHAEPGAASPVPISIVNHASEDFKVDAEIVWQDIVEYYLQGGGYVKLGYRVVPLDGDPAAFRGGYRMTLADKNGKIVDDRVTYITERDDKARRLSLVAQYLAPSANGLIVHATYQAVPIEGGARYLLDAHSRMGFAEAGAGAVAEQVAATQERWQEYLEARLRTTKEQLEKPRQ